RHQPLLSDALRHRARVRARDPVDRRPMSRRRPAAWHGDRGRGRVDTAAPGVAGDAPAMTARALAMRTAARYKARTMLAVAGVAIIAALNFDMLLLSRGLLLSFADIVNSAGFDVR